MGPEPKPNLLVYDCWSLTVTDLFLKFEILFKLILNLSDRLSESLKWDAAEVSLVSLHCQSAGASGRGGRARRRTWLPSAELIVALLDQRQTSDIRLRGYVTSTSETVGVPERDSTGR
jgi:hypothetical protein